MLCLNYFLNFLDDFAWSIIGLDQVIYRPKRQAFLNLFFLTEIGKNHYFQVLKFWGFFITFHRPLAEFLQ